MPALVQRTAALAGLLDVPPDDSPGRLASNALEDPVAEVRLHHLRHLVAAATNAPVTLVVSTAASLLDDAHAPLRLLAAQHAGALAHAALRGLVADSRLELALRVEAARSLGQPSSPDLEGLRRALDEGSPPEVVCAALSVIPSVADASLVEGGAALRFGRARDGPR